MTIYDQLNLARLVRDDKQAKHSRNENEHINYEYSRANILIFSGLKLFETLES